MGIKTILCTIRLARVAVRLYAILDNRWRCRVPVRLRLYVIVEDMWRCRVTVRLYITVNKRWRCRMPVRLCHGGQQTEI